MQTIFLDNFRGFTRAYVDLLDVNFFVGENSTGKTSVLWAVRLLADGNFWFNLNFELDGETPGQFADLASIASAPGKSFALGIVSTGAEKESNDFAILLCFAERDGMPHIDRCMYSRDGFFIQCERSGKRLKWSVADAVPSVKDPTRPFDMWLDHRRATKQTFREMPNMKGPQPFGIELLTALSIAKSRRAKETLAAKTGATKSEKQPQETFDFDIPSLYEENSVAWIAPIRTKPKRTYDEYMLQFSAKGDHTPYLVKRILSTKRQAERFKKFLTRFGEESGLFKSVEIKRYGRGASAPFELQVVLDRAPLGLHNVGYGVSQSLPIAVEAFARPRNGVLIVQQPEVHVHPRGQAALGDLILNTATEDSKKFIIETHSDYLIDRFRMQLKLSKFKPSAQIVFFERSNQGNVPHSMKIEGDGSIAGPMPDGYRKFFLDESLRVIDLG